MTTAIPMHREGSDSAGRTKWAIDRLPGGGRGRLPFRRVALGVGSASIGLLVLIGFTWIGGCVRGRFHLFLPGPVIGLALLAVALVLTEGHFLTWSLHSARHVEPVARRLLSHMGLLFVPAGAGVITEGHVIGREWLPIAIALIGSTLIGLAATGCVTNCLATERGRRSP